MWFSDSWNLGFIPSSSTDSLSDLSSVISLPCASILPSVKMGEVILPPAQSPLISSESKCQALLLSLMCHFYLGLHAGRWCAPHVSSPCTHRFPHSLVDLCRLHEALPCLAITAATGHAQHKSCDLIPAAWGSRRDAGAWNSIWGLCHPAYPARKHHAQWQSCHFSSCDRHLFNGLPC